MILTKECVVYRFHCDLCDAGCYGYTRARFRKRIKGHKQPPQKIAENILRYLSADRACICYEKQTVFREQSSRKTVSFEQRMMSWRHAQFLKLGKITRIFPSFSWGIFSHATRLGQLRASENIRWIIIIHI